MEAKEIKTGERKSTGEMDGEQEASRETVEQDEGGMYVKERAELAASHRDDGVELQEGPC